MKEFLKKYYKKIIILSIDVLCLIIALCCKPLSDLMLSNDSACLWTTLGGQCLTCGGTHFVNDLFSFRIADAFMDNQLLFIMAAYFGITLIVVNLLWLFDLSFARKILKWMYNIPVLIVFSVGTIAFLLWRNIPAFIKIIEIVPALWEKILEIVAR